MQKNESELLSDLDDCKNQIMSLKNEIQKLHCAGGNAVQNADLADLEEKKRQQQIEEEFEELSVEKNQYLQKILLLQQFVEEKDSEI